MFLTTCSIFHQKKTTTVLVTASQIVSMVLLQRVGQKSWMNMVKPYIPMTILMKRYFFLLLITCSKSFPLIHCQKCRFCFQKWKAYRSSTFFCFLNMHENLATDLTFFFLMCGLRYLEEVFLFPVGYQVMLNEHIMYNFFKILPSPILLVTFQERTSYQYSVFLTVF